MNAPQSDAEQPAPPVPPEARRRDLATVRTVATVVIAVAAGWYLMLQLAPVLRPLLTAAFLAYVLMPYHARLRHRVSTPVSLALITGATARSEEHTSELQSQSNLVCRLLLEKKKR